MKIQKVGVIGAGSMGAGIAQKIAQEGIDVVIVDVEDKFVEKGWDEEKQMYYYLVYFNQEQKS